MVFSDFWDYYNRSIVANHFPGIDTLSFFQRHNLQLIFGDAIRPYLNDENQKALHKLYVANAIGETLRRKAICNIHRALLEIGVESVFFKGSVLAVQLYEDPFVRLIGDIDFYVCPHQVEKTFAVLCDLGYSVTREKELSNPHHISMTNGQTYVELHKCFISPCFIKNDGFLSQNTRSILIRDEKITTLDYTNTLVHLLLHIYADVNRFFPVSRPVFPSNPLSNTPKYYYRLFEIGLFWELYDSRIQWDLFVSMLKRFELNDRFDYIWNDLLTLFPNLPRIREVKEQVV